MDLYLDDDSASPLFVRLLTAEGHLVLTPANAGTAGQKDPIHLMTAFRSNRVLLTHNYEDFQLLHELVLLVNGHHPGILVVRRDNDRARDLKPKGIVRALRNLVAASVPVQDQLHILNHWR
jgi:hypothetical protein